MLRMTHLNHLYVESKKKKRYKQTLQNRNRLTERKQTYGYQEERETDKFEIWDSQIHTTTHKTGEHQDLLLSPGNYIIIYIISCNNA